MSPVRHMFPRLPYPESLHLALKYLWQEQQLRLVIELHCGPENYLYFFVATTSQMSFCTWSVYKGNHTHNSLPSFHHTEHDTGEPQQPGAANWWSTPPASQVVRDCKILYQAHADISTGGHKYPSGLVTSVQS